MLAYLRCFNGVLIRELLRFLQQRSRFFSALVRPLLWLFVFAAGFRSALGLSMLPPYDNYILYEEYIVPGLVAMIILFNSMQSSLSMVYDREMGSMKVLLMSPYPRWFLMASKLFANALISSLQVAVFLGFATILDVTLSWRGYLMVLPTLFLVAFLLGSLGILLASYIKQLENFAGVMNFVIFPMFFMSSALYPLWKMREANELLYWICSYNPFTHCVELIRFTLYEALNIQSLSIVVVLALTLFGVATISFTPKPTAMPKRQSA